MTRIPDCRSDEYYNERFLSDDDKTFVKGFDWAVNTILTILDNTEVYEELDDLLDDNKAIIKEGKAQIVRESIQDWAEAGRNELITSMIDSMDEDEYEENKRLNK